MKNCIKNDKGYITVEEMAKNLNIDVKCSNYIFNSKIIWVSERWVCDKYRRLGNVTIFRNNNIRINRTMTRDWIKFTIIRTDKNFDTCKMLHIKRNSDIRDIRYITNLKKVKRYEPIINEILKKLLLTKTI